MILCCFLTSTMMSPPTWNIGYFDHLSIECYTSFSQVEEYCHVSNMRIYLKKVRPKRQPKGDICYLCSHHPTPIRIICLSYPNKNSSYQTCTFHVTFLIFCFSLAIYNIPTESIWLKLGAGIYPIMNVCISTSDQLFCKIKLLYF